LLPYKGIFNIKNPVFVTIFNFKKNKTMKKILMFAAAALLVTGVAFAHGGGKKKKGTKTCCKKDGNGKSCGKEKKSTTANVQ
jgi:hypothetical protein